MVAQVASACRGDAVISAFYLRAKEEKHKSLKHHAEFASTTVASLVDTGNVSDAHCWLTLWLWLVQEEKIKAADHKHSASVFARCELSDAAHAPGSSARASSDCWSKYRAAKIAADERCRRVQCWHVSCWLSTLAWAGTVSRQAAC